MSTGHMTKFGWHDPILEEQKKQTHKLDIIINMHQHMINSIREVLRTGLENKEISNAIATSISQIMENNEKV